MTATITISYILVGFALRFLMDKRYQFNTESFNEHEYVGSIIVSSVLMMIAWPLVVIGFECYFAKDKFARESKNENNTDQH